MTKNCTSLLGAMLVALAPSFCACSSSSGGAATGPGNTPTEAGTDGDGGGGGGGSGDSGGGGGSEAATTGPQLAGEILATETAGATKLFTLNALFSPVGFPTVSCSGAGQVMMGACCYTPPAMGDAGVVIVDAGTGASYPNAGTITVTDGSTTIGTLMPTGPSGTYPADTTAMMWMPGDTLNISAAGATIDAFMGTVKAVSPLDGVTPALSETSPTAIPVSADLVVSWTPDASTTGATVSLTLVTTATTSTVRCSVTESASTATLTIPSAILGMLPKGTAVLEMGRTLSSTATDSNASIILASSTSLTGLGTLQ